MLNEVPVAVFPRVLEEFDLPRVSIVAIGRDEAANLEACFESIRQIDYPPEKVELIYVDTNSMDNSVAIARQCGVRVVEESSDFPTAGLARNAGLREAQHEVIHFVDGDMTVAPGYLKKAVSILGQENIACVIGQLREKRKDGNWLSYLWAYTWDRKKPGFINAPGAGGTFLKSALLDVGGYNAQIPRGQETDLGYRLREKGYQIYLLEELMGTHDYGITSLFGLLSRFYSMGRSFGKVLTLPPSPSYAVDRRIARSTMLQALAILAAVLLVAATGWWVLLLAVPPAVALYVIARYWNADVARRGRCLGYYLLIYAGKPLVGLGAWAFWIKHLVRQRNR